MTGRHARVIVLTSYLPNYQLIASWAERHGHEIALVVTPSGGTHGRYGGGDLVTGLEKGTGLLITGKLRTVAAPVIAALKPDLVISAAFARLIPSEILDVPAYGALNLHPSALPVGRGPNPIRLVYEGADSIGATLHRTEAEFDTGAVLSQRERPLPADLSGPALLAGWLEMFTEVLEEGAAKALAGEPGTTQQSEHMSYPREFGAEERIIDFSRPVAVICRRVAALNVLVPQARIQLPDCEGTVLHAQAVTVEGDRAAPGTVLVSHLDGWTVQAADGAVRVTVE